MRLSLFVTIFALMGCRNEDTREDDTADTAVEPVPAPAGVDWTDADHDDNGVDDMVEGHAHFTTASGADVVVINPTQCDMGFTPNAGYIARGQHITEDGEVVYYWQDSGFGPTFQVDLTSDGFPDVMGVTLPEPGIWWIAFAQPDATSDNPAGWCDHKVGVSVEKLESNILVDPECGSEASMVDAVTEDHEWWSAVARIDCD